MTAYWPNLPYNLLLVVDAFLTKWQSWIDTSFKKSLFYWDTVIDNIVIFTFLYINCYDTSPTTSVSSYSPVTPPSRQVPSLNKVSSSNMFGHFFPQ